VNLRKDHYHTPKTEETTKDQRKNEAKYRGIPSGRNLWSQYVHVQKILVKPV